MPDNLGINLIGFLGANLGQGVAARNTAELLKSRGDRFSVVNVKPPTLPANSDLTWAPSYWRGRGPAPYAVNLFHMNPPEVRAQLRIRPSWLKMDGRLNAIVPFWELSSFPPLWIEVMERMDIVLAPTRFIEDIARSALTDSRIIRFPQTVHIPEDIVGDRSRWGLADEDVAFVMSFDLNSDLSRKNPVGAIQAFRGMREGVAPADANRARLLIKVNHAEGNRAQAARLQELRGAIAGDPSIRLVTDAISYREVLGLYASCDVFLSLHRSEGLGLGLLEAMSLGVPVVATAYSGNLDFMSDEDSCLVGYRLVPVSGTSIGSYDSNHTGGSQMWAEPDLAEATRWMTRLLTDRTWRESLGTAARAAADATRTNPERAGVLQALANEGEHRPGTSRLREFQRRPAAYWRGRQAAGTALRVLGLRR